MNQFNYLDSIQKQFAYYRMLGEKAMAQIPDDQLHWQYNEASNSIAIIVKHLWGNMLSRWTDFLNSDGEKTWRDREAEFDNDLKDRQDIMKKWTEGWDVLTDTLQSLGPENLNQTIYIRNMGHSVVEAIHRQLAHYAYHIGQMVYIARMIQDEEWQSLTIPKGQSKAYNQEKFAQPRQHKHYTDDFFSSQTSAKGQPSEG